MVFGVDGQPLCKRCSESIKIEDLMTPGWRYKGEVIDSVQHADSCALCSMVLEAAKSHSRERNNGKSPWNYPLEIRISDKTRPCQSTLTMIIDFWAQWPKSEFRMLTNEGYIPQKLHGLPYIGIVGPSTSS